LFVGIFHTIQWVKIPRGASTSSTIKAKLVVFVGIPVMVKGGEISLPSQVYCDGIVPLSSNAELESEKI